MSHAQLGTLITVPEALFASRKLFSFFQRRSIAREYCRVRYANKEVSEKIFIC